MALRVIANCQWATKATAKQPEQMDVEIKFPPDVVDSLKRIADNLEESVKMQREAREDQKKLAAALTPRR